VSAFDYDPVAMKATNRVKLVDLPTDGLTPHVTRTLLFMPVPNENTLLISVGSSCNVCHEEDSRRARVLAYDVVTKKTEEFARGLRNTVFMDIHLVTGAIWGTEMGRDGLGDDIPPDEINIIEKEKNYGWPICFGNNIHDDEFDKNTYFRNPCMAPHETPSHIDIQAHSAPLGLAFIPEEGWPEDHWYNLLVAYHGSWNREELTGYKIVRFPLDAAGKPHGEPVDFITGWLRPDGTRIGRPVDIKVFSGGTMYISDDQAGIIYRVVRTEAS
jgi:glucose/arabinose dehydrogenase